MIYVLTFLIGLVIGYVVESIRDMLSDGEEYISLTSKGREYLESLDKDDDLRD